MKRWDDLELVEKGAVMSCLTAMMVSYRGDVPNFMWAEAFRELKVWPTKQLHKYLTHMDLRAVEKWLRDIEGVEEPR